MEALTYRHLIEELVVPEDRDVLATDLAHEVADLVEPCQAGALEQISTWPLVGGPIGPLIGPEGVPLHGAFVRTTGDGLDVELVVCNAGWPIERQRCPGPNPPLLQAADPVNYWVSQQGMLMATSDAMLQSDPGGIAILRVADGRKPFALADTNDERRARLLQDAARHAGLAVAVQRSVCRCGACDGRPVWFLEVARREPFDALVDLDAVADWYAEALPGAGAPEHVDPFVRAVRSLRGRGPKDFLGRSDSLIMAPYNDEGPSAHTAAVGLVLGYWPPTSAALHLRCQGGSRFAARYGPTGLPWWSSLRHWVHDACFESPDIPRAS